jgi:hypothetical protein
MAEDLPTPDPKVLLKEDRMHPVMRGANDPELVAAVKPDFEIPPRSIKDLKLTAGRFIFLVIALAVTTAAILGFVRGGNILSSISITQKAGYWLPDEWDNFTTTLNTQMSNADNNVVVQASLFGNKDLADILSRCAARGVNVVIILDGFDPNKDTNIRNTDYLKGHRIGVIIDDTRRSNINCIVIDGKTGWYFTGPLNANLGKSYGRVTPMSKAEADHLTAMAQKRVEQNTQKGE